MLCILYVNAVGTLLGIAGLLVERVLPSAFSRRLVWCVIIAISVSLPGIYRAQHNVRVSDVLGHEAAPGHVPGTSSLSPLDPGWWARTESYDTTIHWVWLTASGLLLLWGLGNALRVSRIMSVSRTRRGEPGSPVILDGVPVVVTDSIGPATVGLWRSRVLVPRWVLALPVAQQRYVVRHEDEHRRAHDARLLFIASLFLVLVPWNLALWWQLRRLRLAVEVDCDNRVVEALGDARAYGQLLLNVAQAASRGPRLQPALLGGVGMLERRLTVLLAPAPLRDVQRLILPVAAIALLFVVLTMPHPVLGPDAHGTTTTGATTTAAAQHAHADSEQIPPK